MSKDPTWKVVGLIASVVGIFSGFINIMDLSAYGKLSIGIVNATANIILYFSILFFFVCIYALVSKITKINIKIITIAFIIITLFLHVLCSQLSQFSQ